MPVTVTADDLSLGFHAAELVGGLAESLEAHWKRALLAGQRAEGGALPSNASGQPYGQGDGSIATQWVDAKVSGDARQAEAVSSPGQDGGLFYAVQGMVSRDANPASIDGRAAAIIDAVIQQHADKAIQ